MIRGEHLLVSADTTWMTDAACAGVSQKDRYSTFYPSKSGKVRTAIREYCENCPVKVECGEYADALGITSGIWGGRSRSS